MNQPLTHHHLGFVSAAYHGVWRRTLLENAQGKDTNSTVLWLQTREFHADIRIPAGRPDVSGYSRLEECALEDLHWLATQQGFFGVTQVQNDICQWHRKHDFQPQNGARDIGKIAFTSASEMLETGVDENYLEIWHKIEGSQLNTNMQPCVGKNRFGDDVPAFLLSAGLQMAYVRPRSAKLPPAASLLAAVQLHKPNVETLLDWLDFEISFGQMIDDAHWQIRHSTHPFLEGKRMDTRFIEKSFYG